MTINAERIDVPLYQRQRYALNEVLDGQPLTDARKVLLEGLRELNEYFYDQLDPIEEMFRKERAK